MLKGPPLLTLVFVYVGVDRETGLAFHTLILLPGFGAESNRLQEPLLLLKQFETRLSLFLLSFPNRVEHTCSFLFFLFYYYYHCFYFKSRINEQ